MGPSVCVATTFFPGALPYTEGNGRAIQDHRFAGCRDDGHAKASAENKSIRTEGICSMKVSHAIVCIAIGIWIAYTYPDWSAQAFQYIDAIYVWLKTTLRELLAGTPA